MPEDAPEPRADRPPGLVPGLVPGSAPDRASGRLRGRSVLVLGASAGIGQAFAIEAVRAGANVVVAARRADRLAATVEVAGGGTAVTGDVRRPGDAHRIVDAAVAAGGPLDLVLYAAGVAPLQRLVHTDADDWRDVFETNVLGVHEALRAAVPAMAPGGIVAVLSSETVGRPRTGLGAYSASKAAVDESLRGWQLEHPEVRFSCIAVGATQPTEFGDAFDRDLLDEMLATWLDHGLMQESFMDTADVAAFLADTLGAALGRPGVNVEQLRLRSPSPVIRRPDPT